jgi:hypothetical protein
LFSLHIIPDVEKNRGPDCGVRAAISYATNVGDVSTYAAAFFAVGTSATVFRICEAIWYGSPCEFGRRSSR